MTNMETLTLYKKVGKRYFKHEDYLDERGLPCGLYLFYKPNIYGEHQAMMNMIHYAKVHEIKNVAKFSDLFVAHSDKIADALRNCLLNENQLTTNDLINEILTKLSNIE